MNTSNTIHPNPQPRRARIFISYKRDAEPDETVASTVFQALSQHHHVFIDRLISVGANWGARIETELHNADYLIALLSLQAVASEMVTGKSLKRIIWRRNAEEDPLSCLFAWHIAIIYPIRLAPTWIGSIGLPGQVTKMIGD